MNIFIYGDSNTWGYMPNLAGYKKNALVFQFTNSQCWWSGLENNGHNVLVDGLCGRTIARENPWLNGRNALKTMYKTFCELPKNTDLIILQLGTNDCKSVYDLSPQEIADNLEVLINKIRVVSSAEIMIISPPKIVTGTEITDKYYIGGEMKSVMLDGVYKALAIKNGCMFVSGLEAEVGEDGEHLTAKGHRQLGNNVNKAVEMFLSAANEKE